MFLKYLIYFWDEYELHFIFMNDSMNLINEVRHMR